MRSMVAAPDYKDLSNKEKEHTHIQQRKKKYDGQIKKTAKRVTDSTLPCYGAMVGKHDSVWPFKVNPSRNSAYRTEKLTKNTSKNKTRNTRLNYPQRCRQ